MANEYFYFLPIAETWEILWNYSIGAFHWQNVSMSKNTDLPLLSGEKKNPGPRVFCWQSCYYPAACGPGSIPCCIFFFFLRWGKFSLTGEVHSYHKLQDTLLLSLSGLLLFDLLAQKQLSIPLFKCPQNEEDKPPNRQNNNFHWGEKINILPISSSYCPQHICKTVCPE